MSCWPIHIRQCYPLSGGARACCLLGMCLSAPLTLRIVYSCFYRDVFIISCGSVCTLPGYILAGSTLCGVGMGGVLFTRAHV